jgi:hypothetical protein
MQSATKTIEITLGGGPYRVPKFNIGQHERVLDALDGTDGDPHPDTLLSVLGIAMERSDPGVIKVMDLCATFGRPILR